MVGAACCGIATDLGEPFGTVSWSTGQMLSTFLQLRSVHETHDFHPFARPRFVLAEDAFPLFPFAVT